MRILGYRHEIASMNHFHGQQLTGSIEPTALESSARKETSPGERMMYHLLVEMFLCPVDTTLLVFGLASRDYRIEGLDKYGERLLLTLRLGARS